MRFPAVTALAVALLFPWPGKTQTYPEKGLNLTKLEIDQVGRIPGGEVSNFTVQKIIGPNEALVQGFALAGTIVGRGVDARPGPARFSAWGPPFVLKDVSTRGWIDGKAVTVSDVYKVADTSKPNGRTVFVLKPASAEEKARVEAEEKRLAPIREKERKIAKLLDEIHEVDVALKSATGASARKLNDKRREIEKQLAVVRRPQPEAKPKAPEDSAAVSEREASSKLNVAKQLLADGLKDKARARLQEIVVKHPDTEPAREAKKLLEKK